MAEPRRIDRPKPGFWLLRLVKGGPDVAACILRLQTRHEPGEPQNQMERSPFLAAFINGEPVDLAAVWERRGRAITEAEHCYRVALTDWAIQNAPHEPAARPTEAINHMTAPVPF